MKVPKLSGLAWKVATISDTLLEAKSGFASGDDLDVGIFQIRMNNITAEGALNLAKRRRVTLDISNNDSLLVKPGDVLFNATNSPELVGKSAYIKSLDEPTTFSNHFLRLRANSSVIDGEYLSKWLQTQFLRGRFKGMCRQWVNQATVSRDSLLSMQIPLPPLPEQRRIAQILDKTEALRAKRRAALAKLDTLAQSIFLEMFGDPATNPKGWQVSAVGLVSDVQGGLQVTAARNKLPVKVPYLRVGNVYRGRLELSEIKLLQVNKSELLRTQLIKNDLLVVEGHGNPLEIGRCAMWDGSIPDCVHQNHIIRIRILDERITPLFACEYINSPSGRKHLLSSSKTTTGLNTISVTDVRSTPLVLPPLPLQQAFARRVEAIETLKAAHRASLAKLDALFASLQHRAFRGEL